MNIQLADKLASMTEHSILTVANGLFLLGTVLLFFGALSAVYWVSNFQRGKNSPRRSILQPVTPVFTVVLLLSAVGSMTFASMETASTRASIVAECDTVIGAIASGQIKYLQQADASSIRDYCGGGRFVAAANDPRSGLRSSQGVGGRLASITR